MVFDDEGRVTDQFVLRAGSARFGIDIHPGVYHTFVALEPDTVLFEVKPGPWDQATDKDFAAWSPAEGSPGGSPLPRVARRPLPFLHMTN